MWLSFLCYALTHTPFLVAVRGTGQPPMELESQLPVVPLCVV